MKFIPLRVATDMLLVRPMHLLDRRRGHDPDRVLHAFF